MAKIDISQIEGYADMTPEQKLAVLEGFEYDDRAADAERYKAALSKANSESADWKRKYKEQLSADEQKKQESDEAFANMQQELENLRTERQIATHKASLQGLGFNEKQAGSVAKALHEGKYDDFFAAAKQLMDERAKAIEQSVRTELLRGTPTPAAGTGAGGTADYNKLIADARARGAMSEVAYYTRLSQTEQSK